MIPFEKFYNRKPDTSRIVPFGTTAYIEKKYNKNSIQIKKKTKTEKNMSAKVALQARAVITSVILKGIM